MENQLVSNIYTIPGANLGGLEARITKLAAKAKKLGTGAITFKVLSSERRTFIDDLGWEILRTYYTVQVSGPAPKINGWTFIATLEHSPEGVIVRGVPGLTTEGELVSYRASTNLCDYCKKSRARQNTFVLRSDDGAYRQVGRNCLRDFLGHDDPEALAALAEQLTDAFMLADEAEEEAWGYGGHAPRTMSIHTYLGVVAACVRRFGWVPRSKAEEWERMSTTEAADNVLREKRGYEDGQECDNLKCPCTRTGGHVGVTDADVAKVEQALEWVRSWKQDGLDDYRYNLFVACAAEAIEPRRFGIVASLIGAYDREIERRQERAEKEAKEPALDEWVGKVGERVDLLNLTVRNVRALESPYGVTQLHTFKDADGRRYKWFSSGRSYAEGATVNVTATIKSHESYQDHKITVLTRVAEYVSPEEKKAAAKAAKEAKKAGMERGVCCVCWDNGFMVTVKTGEGYSTRTLMYCPSCLPAEHRVSSIPA